MHNVDRRGLKSVPRIVLVSNVEKDIIWLYYWLPLWYLWMEVVVMDYLDFQRIVKNFIHW